MVLIFCLLALPLGMAGIDFRTSALHRAASALGIERQLGHASKGVTQQIVTPKGTTVIFRVDLYGTVEHIGLPLFNPEMRRQMPSPVYDCLEYAALDRCVIFTENDLLLQKIKFYKGSWQTLAGVQPTDACRITTQDHRFYRLVWSRNGHEIVDVVLPIDYELLSVSTRRELEKDLVHRVTRHQTTPTFSSSQDIDPQLAKSEVRMEMTLSSYERRSMTVPLRQWLSYCESQGCKTTIKYDDSDDSVIKGYLLSRNDALGYHHLLELTWRMEDLSQSTPKIKGKVLLFIPNTEKK